MGDHIEIMYIWQSSQIDTNGIKSPRPYFIFTGMCPRIFGGLKPHNLQNKALTQPAEILCFTKPLKHTSIVIPFSVPTQRNFPKFPKFSSQFEFCNFANGKFIKFKV